MLMIKGSETQEIFRKVLHEGDGGGVIFVENVSIILQRAQMISDQLFVLLYKYTIYLSLCTQTAETTSSQISPAEKHLDII